MNAATDDAVPNAQLTIPEAVLLGHALISRVAESLGIRAFFIKGPASIIQGLRVPKVSVDVDVFVAPTDIEQLLRGLRERGWRERPVDPDDRTFPKHSITVDHAQWPCCVDVHFRFPGMEGDPTELFDVMWAHTETLELAGHEVKVPSKALGTLILALHALREPRAEYRQRELEFLKEISTREALAPSLHLLATETGSLGAMRPVLEELIPGTSEGDWPEASLEWRNRLFAQEPGSARILALLQAPARRKPALLFRAVFPAPEVHLSRDIYADMSFRGRLGAHKARWGRFLRSAPQIARDLSQRPRNG